MVADNRNVFVTMTLRDQMTGKVKKIEGSLAQVRSSLDQTAGRVKRTETSFLTLTGNVLKAAPAFAVATAAITSAYVALRLFREEIVGGLKAVESYNIRVASMTGFLTQFSAKTAKGNLVEGFREANDYAKQLVERLEILDARTIASGKELTIMAETFIKNRQVLDVTNREQEQAFLNIVNATKLLTQGQNQEIQLRQEINALVKGEIRPTNMLVKLLQAQNSNIKENLKEWARQGTVIQNVGNMLQGMEASTVLLEGTWAAIGSTMGTIHEKVLRGGFVPIYQDLLEWAKEINAVFMDQNGNLTSQAVIIQDKIKTGWEDVKEVVSDVWWLVKILGPFTEAMVRPLNTFTKGARWFENKTQDLMFGKGELGGGLYGSRTPKPLLGELYSSRSPKGPPQLAPPASVVDEKQIRRLAKLSEEYTRDLQKAWETINISILPEHERKVEAVIRKYDAMREAALVIYGDGGDFALLEEHLAALDQRQDESIKKLKETNKLAADLGFTFSSAFEDAVVAGKELSDILKGLEQDIVRILMRKTITEPLANSLTAGINTVGTFLGGYLGGNTIGMARGGMITEPIFGVGSSGQTYRFGEGGIKERVTPEGEAQGVVNHFTIDARGADAGVELRIRQAIQIATNAAYNKVAADITGRGAISQAIGR